MDPVVRMVGTHGQWRLVILLLFIIVFLFFLNVTILALFFLALLSSLAYHIINLLGDDLAKKNRLVMAKDTASFLHCKCVVSSSAWNANTHK